MDIRWTAKMILMCRKMTSTATMNKRTKAQRRKPEVVGMKNPAGELLDAGEGGHVGHRVVAGGDHHVVEPGDSGGRRSHLGCEGEEVGGRKIRLTNLSPSITMSLLRSFTETVKSSVALL